ncbi:hypothetical protein PYCCODRAFT_1019179 [Trametes coccinea BRFM310]|uniref:Uncharacterized protein n=1 Tax=Trametes coccinea (strain BRFM310) TaxID=1353009 RepID=A0A1Y2IC82_TRAC3|nr:hypothetical protein PYCCODRAFT_1019179 [Trametes coccinea BRFM310]
MFTSLITFFLTVLGALRPTPLYTDILTLGNGLRVKSWLGYEVFVPLLDDKTATVTAIVTGIDTHARALLFGGSLLPSLPAPALVLTLPPGFSDRALIVRPEYSVGEALAQDEALDAILGLIGLVVTIYWLVVFILRLMPGASDDSEDDLLDSALEEAYMHFGKPYDGAVYQTADVLENILTTTAISHFLGESENAQRLLRSAASTQNCHSKKLKSKAVLPSPSTASSSFEPEAPSAVSTNVLATLETQTEPVEATVDPTLLVDSRSIQVAIPEHSEPSALDERPPVGIAVNASALEEEDGSAWMTWSNRRRRRPPRPPPPLSTSALSAARSRSSSIASDSRSVDTLFSSVSSSLTLPTSLASCSRRSSIALPSPSKPHQPSSSRYRITIQPRIRTRTLASTFDKASDNKYSVLETFEAEG